MSCRTGRLLPSTQEGRIMVCFSHTHECTHAAGGASYFGKWYAGRQMKLSGGRGKNGKSMEAAGGIGENTVGVNRRNEPEQMDGRLGILKLAARDGKEPGGPSYSVTAHANVLSGDIISSPADYIGATKETAGGKHTAAQ